MVRQNWRLYSGYVTPDKCEEIIQFCYKNCTLQDGTVFGDNASEHRKTRIGWTEDPELMGLATGFFRQANRDAFGVDIDYMPPLQFGEYVIGSKYDWHHDVNWEGTGPYDRKLSFVLQLSDPETYVGGNFEFQDIEQPVNFRAQGSVLIFPSYFPHRVTEVTKGKRNSLVGWIEGPRWK